MTSMVPKTMPVIINMLRTSDPFIETLLKCRIKRYSKVLF